MAKQTPRTESNKRRTIAFRWTVIKNVTMRLVPRIHMNNLVVGIGCIWMLILPAGQMSWRLPATIEALQDVPAQSVEGSHQLRGVLYVSGGRSFTIAKGQRFLMVKVYGEGECRIKFENKEYDVSSCPWLDGFRDHQEDVFKVVSGRRSGKLP